MTFVCISWIFAGPLCWSVIYIGLVQVWVQYPLLFRAVFSLGLGRNVLASCDLAVLTWCGYIP